MGVPRSRQAQASPLNHTLPHHPQVDSATANAGDMNLDASLCARRSSSVVASSISATPASGSKSTTAAWTSEMTSKLADLSTQGQAFVADLVEVLTTKDAAAWASLCERVGATLPEPKTLALEGEAGSPVEVEGHRDGEKNPDEPAAIAQGTDERDDEPNDEGSDDEKGNGDIAGGDANAAGVITPQLEIESLVAGTAEGDHGDLNDSGDVLRLPLPKTDRKIRHDRELAKAIKYARRRQHTMTVGVRFESAAAAGKVGRNIVWALERPHISVFNRGPIHAQDGRLLGVES